MVKCVVSGCPNRVAAVNKGVFNRPQKRFFSFPKDPARVKVWLAALRETDKQDCTEQHLICEDHFLPEDISKNGVNSDAIPIMPPCLDGPMGMISPWGAESSEEEDQWAAGGGDVEDEGAYNIPFNTKLSVPECPPLDLPKQDPDPDADLDSAAKTSSDSGRKQEKTIPVKTFSREDVSLGTLTRRFLDLFLKSPDGLLELRHASKSLNTRDRRIYDITNVLESIKLIKKESPNRIKWIGTCPVSSFLKTTMDQRELENLKLVEDTLDSLIKSCAQQLFCMTDDPQNSPLAYITHEDISQLKTFQEQTVISVKAPEETKLEVPAPTEDNIQIHLKAGKGPIIVMTCDIGTEDTTAENSGCFLTLEESRIKTSTFHTES